MKKLIAVILSVVMLFSITGLAFAEKEQTTDTPIIIIPGFLQTNLQFKKEDGSFEKVWLPDFAEKFDVIGKNIPEIVDSMVKAFADNPEALGKALMNMMSELMPKMMCNPDGTSLYPVTHYENDPAKRNMHYIKNSGERVSMQAYYTFADHICKEGYAKAENVFVFEYDGRMDALTVADELRDFVKAVKSYSGKDKVRIFGVSYGGQIAETYLHLYKDDGDVEKVVFSVPSFGGTNFGDRLLNGTVDFALDDVIGIIENITGSDTDYGKLLKDVDPEFFSRLLNGVSAGITEYAKYWGSVYSLTSVEYYESLKAKFLHPLFSEELIRRNDIIHYEIMPAVRDTLKKCMESGIEIAIHACSGLNLSLGGEENSDLLLAVKDVTGAESTVLGKRYENGYTGARTECTDESHHHVSPSMEIDASTAYLPEHTWFVDGSHHAMFQYEQYGLALATKAVCTDELKDVYSSPDFPQFVCSDNPNNGVYAEFDVSTSGYITDEDSKLIIENIYKRNKIKILSVKAKGMELEFSPEDKVLSPGETLEVAFNGEIPEGNAVRTAVTVKYIKYDLLSKVAERTFDFTVLSDEKTDSDGKIVGNEFDETFSSGIPALDRLIASVMNVVDIVFVFIEFIRSDAFRYLL